MGFTIRPAREEDAVALIALLNPLIRAGIYTVMDQELSLADQLGFMRGFPERGVFYVAVSNDSQQIVGLQDVVPMSSDLAFRRVGVISTFVALTAHRQGIGRCLSQATFQAARALSFTKISAAVRADNPAALAFYQSQGFRVIGIAQKQALVQGNYIDEVLLEKLIEEIL
jgi:L-amino acid N-acyltransferase YncA